jgi:hypothetical protein
MPLYGGNLMHWSESKSPSTPIVSSSTAELPPERNPSISRKLFVMFNARQANKSEPEFRCNAKPRTLDNQRYQSNGNVDTPLEKVVGGTVLACGHVGSVKVYEIRRYKDNAVIYCLASEVDAGASLVPAEFPEIGDN